MHFGIVTQGSLANSATLGWRTQSRWDWPERGCGEDQPQHAPNNLELCIVFFVSAETKIETSAEAHIPGQVCNFEALNIVSINE